MALALAIFQALAAFPKILDAIEKLAAFIQTQAQIARNDKQRKDAEAAAAKAKKEKDTSDLDKILNPDKK